MNSIPFDGTGERIQRDGTWCVYEFALQLDAIQFWARFDGRWLRSEEFIYPDRPKGLPALREPVDWTATVRQVISPEAVNSVS